MAASLGLQQLVQRRGSFAAVSHHEGHFAAFDGGDGGGLQGIRGGLLPPANGPLVGLGITDNQRAPACFNGFLQPFHGGVAQIGIQCDDFASNGQ